MTAGRPAAPRFREGDDFMVIRAERIHSRRRGRARGNGGGRPRIVVVGSTNVDMIVRIGRIPRPGETVLGGEFAMAAGGKGANQAVAAARAGGAVTFVSRVGRDAFGDRAVAALAEDGIAVGRMARDSALPTGVAFIFVGADGENSIAVASGANAGLGARDVTRAEAAISRADALLLSLEIPLDAVRTAARIAHKSGVPVILNPAPARPLPDELLGLISILTPNEGETEFLTGIRIDGDSAADRAAGRLLRRGVKRAVVITRGRRGAYVAGDGIRRRIPAFTVKAVDTTAAGDAFSGALAVALGESRPLPDAVRFAAAAAAISVTRLGAQPSVPRRPDIDRFLEARP